MRCAPRRRQRAFLQRADRHTNNPRPQHTTETGHTHQGTHACKKQQSISSTSISCSDGTVARWRSSGQQHAHARRATPRSNPHPKHARNVSLPPPCRSAHAPATRESMTAHTHELPPYRNRSRHRLDGGRRMPCVPPWIFPILGRTTQLRTEGMHVMHTPETVQGARRHTCSSATWGALGGRCGISASDYLHGITVQSIQPLVCHDWPEAALCGV